MADNLPHPATSVNVHLREAESAYLEAFHAEDCSHLHAVTAAIASNILLPMEDPVWLGTIGPPASGKSGLLRHIEDLPGCHSCSDISAAGLLSGAAPGDRMKGFDGGLLKTIGEGQAGVIVAKDLGVMLHANDDKFSAWLGMMLDVFDGRVNRHLGTGRFTWHGKAGFVFASTDAIDRRHNLIEAAGNRFLFYRMPAIDVREKMLKARGRPPHSERLQKALRELMAAVCVVPDWSVDDATNERLMALAAVVARSRSVVIRDGRSREVLDYPLPEEPTRLYKMQTNLLHGLELIGLQRVGAMDVVLKVGMDSMPPRRAAIIRLAAASPDPLPTSAVAAALRWASDSAVRRDLADLYHYEILSRATENGEDLWAMSLWAQEKCRSAGIAPSLSDTTSMSLEEQEETRRGSASAVSERSSTPEEALPATTLARGGMTR